MAGGQVTGSFEEVEGAAAACGQELWGVVVDSEDGGGKSNGRESESDGGG